MATNDHSARRRRLLCCLMARKVERMSEGVGKYHRQWASTVASKALLLLVGAEELEDGMGREERYFRGACWIHVICFPSGPCVM